MRTQRPPPNAAAARVESRIGTPPLTNPPPPVYTDRFVPPPPKPIELTPPYHPPAVPPVAPPPPAVQPEPSAPGGVYEVKSGDTLYSIGLAHGVSVAELLRANPGIPNGTLIFPGQQLQIPGGASAAPPKPVAGGAHDFAEVFQRAAAAAGVPVEWATSPALVQLVSHESAFNPAAYNPASGAFGLFQFLESTWREYMPGSAYRTEDPYLQACAGLRYIRDRYGSPEAAWGFWQATAYKDPSYAPVELRPTVEVWIRNGWAGY